MASVQEIRRELIAKRKSTYGGLPWGIWDVECGAFIEVERRTLEGRVSGYVANFARKKDAQAAIDACATESPEAREK